MFQLWDIVQHLVDPLVFLLLASTYLPATIYSLIVSGNIGTLLSPSLFKDAWFARFWGVTGPLIRENASINADPLIKLAHGTVLEIGPGSGEWVHLYDKSKVSKIYGVEPNRDHHNGLRKKIKEAGLSDIYEIVSAGVEELGEEWVARKEVDCVVTIQCLCSIPKPQIMIKELYDYLKDGGQWIVYEHVKTQHKGWVSKYQATIDIVWPTFLGGCSITRDTEKWLREAGQWSEVDIKQPPDEPYYQIIPHIMGVLKK